MNLKSSLKNPDTDFYKKPVVIDRQKIDTVFLDLDGTLLDKHFDDYFWELFVPTTYAKRYNVSYDKAREQLLATYRRVENTLQWTDLYFWSEQLGLDIPALKQECSHLVALRTHTITFLENISRMGFTIYLATNAHPKTLEIKMGKIDLTAYFKEMICSQGLCAAKEQRLFWENMQERIPFDPERTLFIDDTEKVLQSAREYGVQYLIHIAKPSSKTDAYFSNVYPSISDFDELIFKQ